MYFLAWLTISLRLFTIAVSAISGISWDYLIGKKVKKKLGNPVFIRNGIQYYLSRKDLSLDQIVSMANKEIRFVSVSREIVTNYEKDLINGAIIRGVQIIITVLDPHSNYIKNQEHIFGISDLSRKIQDSIDALYTQKQNLPIQKRDCW